ncbi:hypothetical protein J3A83DRAFT_2663663 [Scleroderma citrinum]
MAHAKQVYKYRSLMYVFEGHYYLRNSSYVQGMGGIRTHAGADSARSRAHIYHNQRVYTIHAPTSAPALLHILNLIEWYNLSEKSGTGLNMHWLVKPLKCERKFNNLSDTSLLSRSKVAFVSKSASHEVSLLTLTGPHSYYVAVHSRGQTMTPVINPRQMRIACSFPCFINQILYSQISE